MRKRIAAALLCGILLAGTACRREAPGETTNRYSYTPAAESQTNGEAPSEDGLRRFTVDVSWHDNYEALYRYFDASQGNDPVTVLETKGEAFFVAEYMETGDKLYYEQNGNDIDYYILSPDLTGVRSSLKNKTLSSISSTFMKLSEVSAEMPTLSNVMFMSEENVAGRPCYKYIQRAYQDGEASETVYVWVDAEYGFAARCEAYNESDEMTVNWELLRFSTGDVGETSSVSLGVYDITDS